MGKNSPEGPTECLRSGFSFLSLIVYVKTHILHRVVCACEAASVMSNCDPMDCSPLASSCLWDSPGKNTRVGCHVLLQGNFQTQGWDLHLLQVLYACGFFTAEPQGRPPHQSGSLYFYQYYH